MSGQPGTPGGRSDASRVGSLVVPERIRKRLRTWVDVDAVGADGFWAWLETVLPLIPPPDGPRSSPSAPNALADRVRELATDLVDCAGDRARLIADCDRYYTDNVGLARRVKALEASLRMGNRAERGPPSEDDPEAEVMAERYLPHR